MRFSKIPLGVHTITNLMKSTSKSAGFDVNKKHYSIRKTIMVKNLKKAGVSATNIMAITGHEI